MKTPAKSIRNARILTAAAAAVALAAIPVVLLPNMSARSTAAQTRDASAVTLDATVAKLDAFLAAGLSADEFIANVTRMDALVPYADPNGIDPTVAIPFAVTESAARAGVDLGGAALPTPVKGEPSDVVDSLDGYVVSVQVASTTPAQIDMFVDDLNSSGLLVTVDGFALRPAVSDESMSAGAQLSGQLSLTFWFSTIAPLS